LRGLYQQLSNLKTQKAFFKKELGDVATATHHTGAIQSEDAVSFLYFCIFCALLFMIFPAGGKRNKASKDFVHIFT
jgi:hypothetical protein